MAKKKSKSKTSKEAEADLYVVEVLAGGRWDFGREWERLKAVRATDTDVAAGLKLEMYFQKVAKKRDYKFTLRGREYRIARYVRESAGKTIEPPKQPKKPATAKR